MGDSERLSRDPRSHSLLGPGTSAKSGSKREAERPTGTFIKTKALDQPTTEPTARGVTSIWGGGLEGVKISHFLGSPSAQGLHIMALWRQEEREPKKPRHAGFCTPIAVPGRAGGGQRHHLLEKGSSPQILCVVAARQVSQDRLQAVSGEGVRSSHMEPDDRVWQCRIHRWACLCPDTLGGQGQNHLSSNFLFPNTSFEERGVALRRLSEPLLGIESGR